jgi:uncharacterized protein (TIGR02117 family)
MRKVLRITLYTILSLVLFVLLYLSSAYVLSRIGVDEEANAPDEVEIYLLTNGVHSDLVMPVRNAQVDWSKILPFQNTVSGDTTHRFIAFGWGDKGFYLDTPTWAELKFSTAFKAAFSLSTSAIHATYYKSMTEGEDCKKIIISKAQYARLVSYIQDSFIRDTSGYPVFIKTNAVYGKDDAFYDAKGSYSLMHTCNTWTNNGLKTCGQKACLWTPFDTGIFYQYTKK